MISKIELLNMFILLSALMSGSLLASNMEGQQKENNIAKSYVHVYHNALMENKSINDILHNQTQNQKIIDIETKRFHEEILDNQESSSFSKINDWNDIFDFPN